MLAWQQPNQYTVADPFHTLAASDAYLCHVNKYLPGERPAGACAMCLELVASATAGAEAEHGVEMRRLAKERVDAMVEGMVKARMEARMAASHGCFKLVEDVCFTATEL